MEIENDLLSKLNELGIFFSSVKESASLTLIDQETASNGLNKVELIRNIVHKHKKEPRNIFLRQIHGGLFSMVRGMEFFVDPKTNEDYIESCRGIYELVDKLESAIKWTSVYRVR